MSEDRIGVQAPPYKGFCYRLIETTGIHSQTYENVPTVSLYIKTLGRVSDVHHSSETGRFSLSNPEQDGKNAHRIHLLGDFAH